MLLASCDDGHIDDPVKANGTENYTVQIVGKFTKSDTWSGSYSVVAACFDGESPYSLTQAPLPSDDSGITLNNVPATAKTIEIAVVNTLRKRIASIKSYEIADNSNIGDTVKIDIGTLNVGMYETINQLVFQGNSCSRCHGSESPAANLDLTAENAYGNLVGVKAAKDRSKTRVIPGDADNSFLYKVITEGDANVSYPHPALFASETYSNFLTIIHNWINNGAKE